jgi:predicted O-methyltransferase YrrM
VLALDRVRRAKAKEAVIRRVPVLRRYHKRLLELAAKGGAHQRFEPGHFYSPVPDTEALRDRHDNVFAGDPTALPGIDLRLDEQWRLLESLAPLAAGASFPDEPAEGQRFWLENDSFGYGDAATFSALLRSRRSRRIVEIGAGYSTACVLDTIDMHGLRTQVTVIEPYPDRLLSLLRPEDRQRIRLVAEPVESVALETFSELQRDDVLFIDSSHVLKTGSDVAHELHHVLPSLAPGVLVHFHDIFPGFEYPVEWVYEGRGWNEAYALRAFLQFNDQFEILLWPHLLYVVDGARTLAALPSIGKNLGGSLWLRRAD